MSARPEVAERPDVPDERLRNVIEDGEAVLLLREATVDSKRMRSSVWSTRRGVLAVTARRVLFTWRRLSYSVIPLPWHGLIDWPLASIDEVDYVVGGHVSITTKGRTYWLVVGPPGQLTYEKSGRELVSVIEDAKGAHD